MQTKLILLAEDNIVNQKVATRQLEKLGYNVDAVGNGKEALAALERIPYDLVLMDCQMPEMDGYEATAAIRQREGSTKHTMIVAMTAHAMKGDREKCIASGMDDYISKPVKPQDLAALLERIFAGPVMHQQNDDQPTATPPPVDLDHLHNVMGEDVIEIVDLYLTGTTQNLGKLASAIQLNDIHEVEMLAHASAGTSATCGMLSVVPAFRALEKEAREGSLSNAPALLGEAKQQFERICSFLETSRVLVSQTAT